MDTRFVATSPLAPAQILDLETSISDYRKIKLLSNTVTEINSLSYLQSEERAMHTTALNC